MHPPIFAFDFSMNKPAMVCLISDRLEFHVWPANIDKVSYATLDDCGVHVTNRNLDPVKNMDEHTLIYEHVKRAMRLSDMILNDITNILERHEITDYADVIISNEGLAFSAKGNAALDLSGYKYILMKALIDKGFTNLKTYSPITIKSIAGCSKKGMGGKDNMILAIANEKTAELNTFTNIIKTCPEALKKKTSFVTCTDDLADAYWCMKTTVEKENIDCIFNNKWQNIP